MKNPKKLVSRMVWLLPFICALIFSFSAVPVFAGGSNDVWNGGAAPDGNWLNGANWGGVAPSPGDLLFFGSGTQFTTANNFSAGTVFDNLTFTNGSSSFTLAGNLLILTNAVDAGNGNGTTTAGGISNASANAQTISLPMTLAAGKHLIATTAAGQLNLAGPVNRSSGTFILFTTNVGAINLNGGGVAVTNGIIGSWALIGSGNAGTSGTDWATTNSGGNVAQYSSYTTLAAGSLMASDGTKNYKISTAGSTVTMAAGTTDANSIISTATANQTIDPGANNTLRLGPFGGIMNEDGNSSSRVLTIGASAGTGFLTAGGSAVPNNPGELTLIDLGLANTANSLTINSVITNNGTGPVTVNVLGYVVFNGANTYSGGTFINQGRITVNSATTTLGTGPVFVMPGGQLFDNSANLPNDLFIAGTGSTEADAQATIRANKTLSGTVTLTANARVGNGPTFTGKITGPGGLEHGGGGKNVAGTSKYGNSANDYSGNTTINASTGTTPTAAGLQLNTPNCIPNGPGKGNVILIGGASTVATLNLNGNSDTINGLISQGNEADAVVNSSAGTPTLSVGDNDTSSAFNGVIQGTLSLTKIGAGTLTLNNLESYTGVTTVSNGTLLLGPSGSMPSSSLIAISSAGTLDVSQVGGGMFVGSGQTLGGNGVIVGNVTATPASSVNAGLFGPGTLTFTNSLTLNGDSVNGVTNYFTLSGNPSGPNSLITIPQLVLSGNNTIAINGFSTLQSGRYRLISYGSESVAPGSAWVLVGFSASGRQTATVVDTGAGEIDLVVGGTSANLVWVGDGLANNWDTNTTRNWFNSAIPGADFYFDGDQVSFTDSGSENPAAPVNLVGPLSPGSVTVSNTGTCVFTGPGAINGVGGVTKNGPGTLVLNTANNYGGGTTLNGGTLDINNATALGSASSLFTILGGVIDNTSFGPLAMANNNPQNWGGDFTFSGTQSLDLGTGPVTLGGNRQVNVTAGTLTVGGVVGGAFSLTKSGSGMLVLGGANTFTGGTTIAAGILQTANGSALGTQGAIVNPGATLDLFAQNLGSRTIIISGDGAAGQGAITNSSGQQINAIGVLTLAADASVGATGPDRATGRWDVRNAPSMVNLNGHTLTKNGPGKVAFVASTFNAGNIFINAGTLSIETTPIFTGAVEINVNTNAILGVFGEPAGVFTQPIALNAGLIQNQGNNSIIDANITLLGSSTLDSSTFTNITTLRGPISDGGNGYGLTNIGSGTFVLSGTNTYSGPTYVNSGALALRGTGSIFNSPQIIVSGGNFDVSGLATAFSPGTNLLSFNGGMLIVGTNFLNNAASLAITNAALQFSIGIPGTPSIIVTNLSLGDDTETNYVSVTGLPVFVNQTQFPLIKYGTLSGVYNLGLTNLPAGALGFLSNNIANNSIDLVLTSFPNAIWNGGSASDSLWTDPANWGGITISTNDSLFFAGGNRLNNTNDTAAGTTYSNLVFNSTAGAFVLNGNFVTLTGNVTNGSASPQSINLGINFGTNLALNAGSGGLAVLGGLTNTSSVTNVITVTMSGTGSLGSALSDLEPTIFSETSGSANWTLVDSSDSAPGIVAAASFNINGGATLNFGTSSSAPNLTFSAGTGTDNGVGNNTGTSTFNMINGTLTLPVRLNTQGSGNVNVSGGTLNIAGQMQNANGAATDTSVVTVTGGVLNIGTIASPGSATWDLASRGTSTANIIAGLVECGTLDVTRNAATPSVGVVNLNGGILQCRLVSTVTHNAVTNSVSGTTATFNFNGGTLRAGTSSATFFQGGSVATLPNPTPVPINAIVKTGGAIIDDNGHAITISEILKHDPALGAVADGGLTKEGSGTLTLGTNMTYTGNTTVSAGTLALGPNGGFGNSPTITLANGSTLDSSTHNDGAFTLFSGQTLSSSGTAAVAGDFTNNPGSIVSVGGAGAIGILNVSGTVTLQGSLQMDVNKSLATNDVLAASTINYGGTLVLSNISGNLAPNDTFQLFSAGTFAGSFAAIQPSTPGAGLQWNTNNLLLNGTLSVSGSAPTGPMIGLTISGTSLTITGTGGADNGTYRVLSSASITQPLANWTQIGAGSFDSNGGFSFNGSVNPVDPARFYVLVSP